MMARSPSASESKAGYIDARPLTTNSTNPLATRGRTIHWVTAVDQAIREADAPRLSDKHLLEQVRSHLNDAAVGAFASKIPSDTIGAVTGRPKSNPLLRRLRSARHVSTEKSQELPPT